MNWTGQWNLGRLPWGSDGHVEIWSLWDEKNGSAFIHKASFYSERENSSFEKLSMSMISFVKVMKGNCPEWVTSNGT